MKKNRTNSYLEDFEGMIVRMDYLKRSSFDEAYYNEFKHLAKITAGEMYRKYGSFYRRISYHLDDVEQLCSIYLVSYLSLYSFKHNEEVYDRFAYKYLERHNDLPPIEMIKKQERNRVIKFLRQQCQNSILTINRKSRNIIAGRDAVYYFAHTKESVLVNDNRTLLEHSEKYNYRKVTLKEYKMLRKKSAKKDEVKDAGGFRIVVVQDLAYSEGDDDNLLYITDDKYSPETVLNREEDERFVTSYEYEFNNDSNKVLKLKSFIKTYKNDYNYREEVGAARKMLKGL